jgi:hypothetical protein
VEVLSSRILLRPADLGRSHHFYRDVLGEFNRSSQHFHVEVGEWGDRGDGRLLGRGGR